MQLEQLLKSLEQRQQAPTHLWNPPYCGELPMLIDEHGQWHYSGSPIQRAALVKLFASVLVKEGDDYFLVTPAEKVKITVVDVPFVITTWQRQQHQQDQVIGVTTNIGESFPLSATHPLQMRGQVPYVDCGRELWAKVHRNVLYQWAEIAEPELYTNALGEQRERLVLTSAGQKFTLAELEPDPKSE
ncbi:MAG: DUF1285 domain-containing protein [Pseudidiomarina maritima]|nr:DUF1285 domain-containing protein [Pseudidiomarina maritima]